MGDEAGRYFYRVTKRVPPEDDFYDRPREKYDIIPAGLSDEDKRAWDAWSFYTSESGARHCGEVRTHLGGWSVRFQIPEGSGLSWDKSDETGHVNIRGYKDTLGRCFDHSYSVRVRQR